MIKIILPFILPAIVIVAGLTHAQENKNVTTKEMTKTFVCAKHDYLVNDLTQQWKQERVWYGLTNDKQIIELFINKINNTFTIITTGTDKISCGLSGGDTSSFIE
jgi:hypothetical protein|tara:strand:- start:437 stop:751 length:315 start_codon:yes stop_codon:yes gene_type:complete